MTLSLLSCRAQGLQYYLGKGKKIKILILECIEKEDKIRENCDNFFKGLNNLIKYKNNVLFKKIVLYYL